MDGDAEAQEFCSLDHMSNCRSTIAILAGHNHPREFPQSRLNSSLDHNTQNTRGLTTSTIRPRTLDLLRAALRRFILGLSKRGTPLRTTLSSQLLGPCPL